MTLFKVSIVNIKTVHVEAIDREAAINKALKEEDSLELLINKTTYSADEINIKEDIK